MAESDIRPGSTTSHKPDRQVYPDAGPGDDVLEKDLTEEMIRRPTEADFEGLLTPEGNRGDTVSTGISGSTTASNASIGGTE